MGTYKGNVGHLMQHWTLCELLTAAKGHCSRLNFIDAYAMAPWATERHQNDAKFDAVRDGLELPVQKSVYEQAWYTLAAQKTVEGYPNSAAFVREVLNGVYSMLLCEIRSDTANEINEWLNCVRQDANCRQDPELFPGDWRDRFRQGLPSLADVGLPCDSLTLVSFDPNVCSRSRDRRSPKNRPWNLYPKDLELALSALDAIRGGTIIQLSTYSTNGANPQDAVIASVDEILTTGRFQRVAVVRVHGSMMSLVYARDVEWSNELTGLPSRFEEWNRSIC